MNNINELPTISEEDLVITEFQPSDYFDSDDMAREYLDNAFSSGNPEQALYALGQVAKYRGIDKISNETGLARSSLYRYFSGKGNPSFMNIQRVVNSLNMNLHVGA